MGRIGRLLAVLTLGGLLLLVPATTGPAADAAGLVPAHEVAAAAPQPLAALPAQAPPGPDLTGDNPQPMDQQQLLSGIGGVVLIALVLLSRRWRKKPMFGFKWKS
ncbi:hypothetical protein [Saccharopolyspora sp. SCSIO 74807]|uniref:hypothetical protein n=1 Tax=Saccharopolyspora sp. SCSIO 74807 TaxID=3118084 RepID=UPI0030CDE299